LKQSEEFNVWTKGRKFAPTITALKEKLNAIKLQNWISKQKISDFNLEQAEIISARITKITTHFANHLKDDDTMVDESIEWIERVFKINAAVKY
jgi:glutamyl-tRNA reductase